MSSIANETSVDTPQLQPDLPSPRLPPEILDRILDHIDGETWSYYRNPTRIRYGRAISLVCRAWRERGTAWVWSRVDLNLTKRDRKLQHMLAYPRTAKGLEMLYTNGPAPYEELTGELEPEERYKEATEQNCRDLGRLFSRCGNLRELQIMSGQGAVLGPLFPPDAVAKYPTIKTVNLRADTHVDSAAFMRMLHAFPGVEHLNVPWGLLTIDRSALNAESALVRRLPPMGFRDLFLDWSATPISRILSEVIFRNVLYAVKPATLGQLSLSPVGRTTLALLCRFLPTFTTLDYLCLRIDGQEVVHDFLGAFAAAMSGLPKLEHLILQTCESVGSEPVEPAPMEMVSAFFAALPYRLETLVLNAVLPPAGNASHRVPDSILDFIDSRARMPIYSIDYKLRQADKVTAVSLEYARQPSPSADGADPEYRDSETGQVLPRGWKVGVGHPDWWRR